MCHTLIYSFLVTLGLCCCTQAFFSCSERGYSSLCCTGFSLWWLLLLWGTCSRSVGFTSCDTWALICSRHVDSSWTRNRTHVLLHWQADSQPLDHQGSPTVAMLTNNVVPSQPLAVLTLLSAVSGIPVCTWDGSAERNLGTLL